MKVRTKALFVAALLLVASCALAQDGPVRNIAVPICKAQQIVGVVVWARQPKISLFRFDQNYCVGKPDTDMGKLIQRQGVSKPKEVTPKGTEV